MGISNRLSDQINKHLNASRIDQQSKEKPREYLGASILGKPCARQVQYMWKNIPEDEGKKIPAHVLRIFDIGRSYEELIINWIREANFTLKTLGDNLKQIGFTFEEGKIRGHIDGIIQNGPKDCGPYPRLWECKSMNAKRFYDFSHLGLQRSNITYYNQVQIYMHQLKLHKNPAILTGINKDNGQMTHEAIPYDKKAALEMNTRAKEIIKKTENKELMPRISSYRSHFECRYCSWQERCWKNE